LPRHSPLSPWRSEQLCATASLQATDGDEVVAAYVRQLVADKRHDLVATYASQLPPDQQVRAYVIFLEGTAHTSRQE